VRPRSANEWRSFWRSGGDAELRRVLTEVWPPLRRAPEAASARAAERIATLLGSNAPPRALGSELGRIRSDELGIARNADTDRAAAEAILDWFATSAAVDTKS
jgi:hypothetical protein